MSQNYQVEYWLKKLLTHYNLSTYTQLAIKLHTTQQNITNWKKRNSVLAVEKKCREVGIYQKIFEDFGSGELGNDYVFDVVLFKLSTLTDRQRAILYHALRKNQQIKSKEELIDAIQTLDLIELFQYQLKKLTTIFSFKFTNFKNIFIFKDDDTGAYPFDRNNLAKFIQNNLNDTEINVWLKNPYLPSQLS